MYSGRDSSIHGVAMKLDDLINVNGTPYISLFEAQRIVADAAKIGVAEALKETGVTQTVPSPWKTAKEAAAYLGVSVVTINRMRKSDTLKANRRGSVIRYHVDDLDQALTSTSYSEN